jgi:hypothetical protein
MVEMLTTSHHKKLPCYETFNNVSDNIKLELQEMAWEHGLD